jgi:hypothetical protein
MASHQEDLEARRNGGIAIVEDDSIAVDGTNHTNDVVDLVSATHEAVRHLTPGHEGHFAVLDMKSGIGKELEVAGVIEVHVSDHDIVDFAGVHTKDREALDRRLYEATAPAGGNLRTKPRVDDADPLRADCDP